MRNYNGVVIIIFLVVNHYHYLVFSHTTQGALRQQQEDSFIVCAPNTNTAQWIKDQHSDNKENLWCTRSFLGIVSVSLLVIVRNGLVRWLVLGCGG